MSAQHAQEEPIRMSARPFIERLPLFGVVLAILLVSGVASAASGGGDHDVLTEAIYQGVNLLIVVGLIYFFGRVPIKLFFSERRSTIRLELDQAADLLAQAEQRNADLQRRLGDLASELEDLREGATQRAEQEAERILADARATADRIRHDAQSAIDQELRRAQAELRDEAANLALEIAARKLSETVTDSDRERLMDEFITRVEPAAGAEGASR
jgi:F-type H+-transporting ATPase subunit b